MDGSWRTCRGKSGHDLLKQIQIAMRDVRTSSLAARENRATFSSFTPPVERGPGRLLAIYSQLISLTGRGRGKPMRHPILAENPLSERRQFSAENITGFLLSAN